MPVKTKEIRPKLPIEDHDWLSETFPNWGQGSVVIRNLITILRLSLESLSEDDKNYLLAYLLTQPKKLLIHGKFNPTQEHITNLYRGRLTPLNTGEEEQSTISEED